ADLQVKFAREALRYERVQVHCASASPDDCVRLRWIVLRTRRRSVRLADDLRAPIDAVRCCVSIAAQSPECRLAGVGRPEGRGLAEQATELWIELVDLSDCLVAVVDGPGQGDFLGRRVLVQHDFPDRRRPAYSAVRARADADSLVVELARRAGWADEFLAAGEFQHPDQSAATGSARQAHSAQDCTAVVDAFAQSEQAENAAARRLECRAYAAGARPLGRG